MTITVNERYLHGKHGGDETLDEDGIFVGHTFAAVVDGVTSKSRMNPWNPSPGVVAKNTVIETIAAMDVETDTGVSEETFLHEDPEQADANEETWGMRAMQRRIDKALRARYRTHPTHNEDYFATHPLERLQANAVVYSSETHEIWLFGDCQAMINGQRIPTTKKTDELLSALRSFVWQAQELEHNSTEHTTANSGKPNTERPGTDPSRYAIMPFLRMQSAFANKRGEYGYFVFDGYTDPQYPIRVLHVDPGDDIVLASDGYPFLEPTLSQSETALADLKASDPHLVSRFPSTKGFEPGLDSFDDRSYLRLTV